MRIEGTHNTQGTQKTDLPKAGAPAGLPKSAGPAGQEGSPKDVSEPNAVPLKAYVRSAMESEEVNLRAVAEAKELLQSGQLDTSDAIRRAAESILDRGI